MGPAGVELIQLQTDFIAGLLYPCQLLLCRSQVDLRLVQLLVVGGLHPQPSRSGATMLKQEAGLECAAQVSSSDSPGTL